MNRKMLPLCAAAFFWAAPLLRAQSDLPAVPQEREMKPNGRGIGNIAHHELPGESENGTDTGLRYHGGPVMTAPKRLYYVWYGDWSNNTAPAILSDFANHLGGSSYFNTNASYYDGQGRHVLNQITLAGSIHDHYSKGNQITNHDIPDIVRTAIDNGLPADPDGIYVVMTSADVDEAGFCRYCGWHGHGPIRAADLKYVFAGDADRCPSVCAPQRASPNGNAGADAMANVLAHEISETVTDPDGDAWYGDASGGENGDVCAWRFGATQSLPDGAKYNVTLGARKFLLQQLWVNDRGGYCGLGY